MQGKIKAVVVSTGKVLRGNVIEQYGTGPRGETVAVGYTVEMEKAGSMWVVPLNHVAAIELELEDGQGSIEATPSA